MKESVEMASLAIFANFRIDTEERFLRMKDSFLSFKAISSKKWLINVRGQYKEQAAEFLRAQMDSSTLRLFNLESAKGWFHDSRIIAKEIDTEFVFFWIEDHINIVSDMSKYEQILTEMESAGVDYLPYSFFGSNDRYSNVSMKELDNIRWVNVTKTTFAEVQKKEPRAYIFGCIGIFSASLFKRVINSNDWKQRIKWSKEVPFDFEKSSYDTHWLPIVVGLPKQELFVSIDDDHDAFGSSLISMGLYPNRTGEKRITATTEFYSECYPENEVLRFMFIMKKRLKVIIKSLLRYLF